MEENILEKTLLSDIVKNKKTKVVWTVNCTQPIRVSIKILEERKIRSIPVYDSLGKTYLGSVNVLDIAGYIAAQAPKQESYKEQSKQLFERSVEEVIKFYKSDLYLPMLETYSLKLSLKALSNIVHAIPITHPKTGLLSNIITQSDVNRYIVKNGIEKFFGKMAHTPVKDFSNLVVGFDLVYKVQSDAIVVDVLNILFQKKITAVAVINKDGKLVGNFSASDLRGLTMENFGSIYGPVNNFINLTQTIFSEPSTSKLSVFIEMLANHNVHRIWIVDSQQRPVGLVSLSDVMKILNTPSSFLPSST